MARFVSDATRIMRLAIGRRNENDPDSSDSVLLSYLNDFISLSMPNDLKLFEQWGTLKFTIDETNTTGVYTFNDVGADSNFINISQEGFITLTDPADESTSWNKLSIYQNPSIFFQKWGINNTDILTTGYPTEMLFYGNELTFRTIPDTSYDVTIYGYKIHEDFSDEGNPELPFDYWLRYLAYGAALNYARDYRYDPQAMAGIEKSFARERELLMTREHSQAKLSRCQPRF